MPTESLTLLLRITESYTHELQKCIEIHINRAHIENDNSLHYINHEHAIGNSIIVTMKIATLTELRIHHLCSLS